MRTWNGIIIVERQMMKKMSRPGQRMRAKPYATSVLDSSAPATAPRAYLSVLYV